CQAWQSMQKGTEKGGLLLGRLQQRDVKVRPHERDRNAGKAGAASNIDKAPRALDRRCRDQAVAKMAIDVTHWIGACGQVDSLVPEEEEVELGGEAREMIPRQHDASEGGLSL